VSIHIVHKTNEAFLDTSDYLTTTRPNTHNGTAAVHVSVNGTSAHDAPSSPAELRWREAIRVLLIDDNKADYLITSICSRISTISRFISNGQIVTKQG
jgi:hypothetical protein